VCFGVQNTPRKSFDILALYKSDYYYYAYNDNTVTSSVFSWNPAAKKTNWTKKGCRFYTTCQQYIHRVSKNVPPLACYNFDAHEWILIFFGRNVTDKVGNQKSLYYASSNNLCFCTTWQNAETRKSHISLNGIVLHTQCTCALSSWKKNVIWDVFDSI